MKKQFVIILHGWGLSGERFKPLLDILTAKGYRVFAPDMPGFGKAAAPSRPYHLQDYAQFLRTYIQKNNIQDPVLIGHSFGGRVALKYQMLFPGSVHALILTGTPGFTPVPRKKLVVFITLAKVGKFIFSIWPLNLLQEAVRRWYYYLVGARDFYRAEGVMREVFKHIVQEDLTVCLKSVHVPCFLIWGENDLITPVWIARRMHDVIAGSKLAVIPEADHGVSYKQPDRFMHALEGALKTL